MRCRSHLAHSQINYCLSQSHASPRRPRPPRRRSGSDPGPSFRHRRQGWHRWTSSSSSSRGCSSRCVNKSLFCLYQSVRRDTPTSFIFIRCLLRSSGCTGWNVFSMSFAPRFKDATFGLVGGDKERGHCEYSHQRTNISHCNILLVSFFTCVGYDD